MLTRREALLAGASAVVLAGCGTTRPARMIAGDTHDLRVLAAALEVERDQIALYQAGLKLRAAPIMKTILDQERAHAAAIEEAIRELGGTPAPARPRARFAKHESFGVWRQEAIGAEEQWSQGYAALIPKLANQRLRGTFGALMTTEAEHAVALDLLR